MKRTCRACGISVMYAPAGEWLCVVCRKRDERFAVRLLRLWAEVRWWLINKGWK